eukprot:m.386009 g.386009  ORF g.386009 m.386009 type:complete len:60 (+) comp21012_c0_seq5:2291-2470(+)
MPTPHNHLLLYALVMEVDVSHNRHGALYCSVATVAHVRKEVPPVSDNEEDGEDEYEPMD